MDRRWWSLPGVLAAGIAMQAATAAEVEWVEVERKEGHILISAEIHIDAPSQKVFDALLAYDSFAEVSDHLSESRYIEPAADGTPRIYTLIEGCIWFFCRRVERTARLYTQPSWQITATAEPELSDAELSIESWSLAASGEQTVIDYRHEIVTGFWVPPLIGVWVIRGAVKGSAYDAAVVIEDIANGALPTEANNQPGPAD